MFSAFTNFVNDIALGPEQREINKYLHESTRDSIPQHLGQVLLSQLTASRDLEYLRTTFDKYCISSPSGRGYWYEDSFRAHVRSIHPESVISHVTLQLLWKSFLFYAHHPFPPNAHGQVGFDAFRRGVMLTVYQHDNLLGTREFDWYWRHDAEFFRRASFERIFRSIAHPAAQASQQQNGVTASQRDMMDVLIMVVPQHMHAAPSPDQLETVAQKLLPAGSVASQKEVKREHLTQLFSLLTRMRLSKETWGSSRCLGDFAAASSSDNELIQALVSSLAGDESNQTITSDQFLRAIDTMPNLQERFCQLWSVLFQPVVPATAKTPHCQTLAAISLFAPAHKINDRYPLKAASQGLGATLERLSATQDSHDVSLLKLTRDLSGQSRPFILIFGDDEAATASKSVVGAYSLRPIGAKDGEAQNKSKTDSNTSHLLFQLKPAFRLLSPDKLDTLSTKLINTNEPDTSLSGISTDEPSNFVNSRYWIGDEDAVVGLEIDPENKWAVLKKGTAGLYKELGLDREGEVCGNWEVKICNCKLDILTVKEC